MNCLLTGQETPRMLFRSIALADYHDWLVFFKSPMAFHHWLPTLDSQEIACDKWYEKQFFRYKNNLGGMNALVEKGTGKLIGHAGLLRQTVDEVSELEVAYSLLPDFWNKGFATEAASKCKDFAFHNNLSDRLISIISVTNTPSEKVAIKNGMWVEGQTVYKGVQVNIFRITQESWRESFARK